MRKMDPSLTLAAPTYLTLIYENISSRTWAQAAEDHCAYGALCSSPYGMPESMTAIVYCLVLLLRRTNAMVSSV